MVFGVALMAFATWLYLVPRIKARSHPDGHRGATILWYRVIDGRWYALQQYDRGAHADYRGEGILNLIGPVGPMFSTNSDGHMQLRPEGAANPFTMIAVADLRWTVPIGIDRILFGLGLVAFALPGIGYWHAMRSCKDPTTNQPNKAREDKRGGD